MGNKIFQIRLYVVSLALIFVSVAGPAFADGSKETLPGSACVSESPSSDINYTSSGHLEANETVRVVCPVIRNRFSTAPPKNVQVRVYNHNEREYASAAVACLFGQRSRFGQNSSITMTRSKNAGLQTLAFERLRSNVSSVGAYSLACQLGKGDSLIWYSVEE